MSPRTRSDTMAASLRMQAELARAKGKSELAEMLEQQAQRFDLSRATIVPGTMKSIRLEAT